MEWRLLFADFNWEISNYNRFGKTAFICVLALYLIFWIGFRFPIGFYFSLPMQAALIAPFALGFVIAYIIELGFSVRDSISYDKGDELTEEDKKAGANKVKYLINPNCKIFYTRAEQKIICKEIQKMEHGHYRQAEITYAKMYGMYSVYKIIVKEFNERTSYDDFIDIAQSATCDVNEKLI